jgi:hypothetical protein
MEKTIVIFRHMTEEGRKQKQMAFSKRKKLEQEFYDWKDNVEKEYGFRPDDSPLTVISFLDSKHLLKEDK